MRNRRRARQARALEESFFQRFHNRTLIVHGGLPASWIDELLKTGGGGRHFRIDVRQCRESDAVPVSWVLNRAVLPLSLPLPLILLVEGDTIRIRHLLQNGHVRHPADIPWIVDDMRERSREHAVVSYQDHCFTSAARLAPEDNTVETPYGTL